MKLFNIAKNRPTHGARLERWLGKEQVQEISNSMKDWYGPPIAVAGVPGNVWALPGGDFGGIIKAGQFLNATEFAIRSLSKRIQAAGYKSRQQCNTGFSSLSDLIASATAGQRIEFQYSKTALGSPTIGLGASYWNATGTPSAGAAGSAAPGGRATDSTTTGAMPFSNPGGSDTLHFITGYTSSSQIGTVLLYDRIFDVAKTMSSTATEAVTGVPTRYQSNTPTDPNFAGGNFCFPEIQTTLGAGAHNWTTCLYRNQAGTDNQTFQSATGLNGVAAGRIDLAAGWFIQLQSGDYGVADLAQMQSSGSFTGGINFVIGHPIAFMPCPIANLSCVLDGINTSFNLVRIFNDACLTFLWINSPVNAAGVINGSFTTVYG